MCFGDGKCMKICTNHFRCLIPEHETSNYSFCKTKCENNCELIRCPNFLHCNSSFPFYFYKENNEFIKNGICGDCSIFDVIFLKEKRECLRCSDITYMIETKCKHEICFSCLLTIEGKDVYCPFCQTLIE
jgi:hypothetical protein